MSFTSLPALSAGQILTADHIAAIEAAIVELRPLRAVKTADETLNSAAAFQNDDHLVLTVVASATYHFRHTWVYNSGTTPDLKSQYSVPSGTTMAYTTQASISIHAASGLTEASTVIYDGDGSDVTVNTIGYIIVSTTAGNVQWQWAQNTSDVGSTIVRKGSMLELIRVA